jgi:adenylylsulfate kinase
MPAVVFGSAAEGLMLTSAESDPIVQTLVARLNSDGLSVTRAVVHSYRSGFADLAGFFAIASRQAARAVVVAVPTYDQVMGSSPGSPANTLLITGTVGVGKTTVAETVGHLLAERGAPHAVIDLDQLSRCWPPPPGDRFNLAVELRNLESVAANYRAAGAGRLILAGVVEHRVDLHRYRRALHADLTVIRLRADPNVLQQRLCIRHRHDPAGLAWHLSRAPELDAILDEAQTADAEIDIGDHPITTVAANVIKAACW